MGLAVGIGVGGGLGVGVGVGGAVALAVSFGVAVAVGVDVVVEVVVGVAALGVGFVGFVGSLTQPHIKTSNTAMIRMPKSFFACFVVFPPVAPLQLNFVDFQKQGRLHSYKINVTVTYVCGSHKCESMSCPTLNPAILKPVTV